MFPVRCFLLSSLGAIALSGCAVLQPAPVPVAADAPAVVAPPAVVAIPPPADAAARTEDGAALDPQTRAYVEFQLMAGELAADRQQPAMAAAAFLEVLQHVDKPELAQRATALAAAAQDEELAARGAQRWLELEPTSADAREIVARLALRRGDLAEAEAQSRELIRGHAGGIGDGFRQVALFLAQAGPQHQEPILLVMDRLVADWPQEAGAHHAMSLLALRFGQLPVAERAALQANTLAPKERDHVLLLVAIYLQQDRLADAEATAEKLIKGADKPAELRVGYARLLLDSGQREAGRAQLRRALTADPTLHDARFALGILAAGERDFDEATTLFKPLLDGPRAQDAAFELGRISELQQRDEEALAYYDRVTRGPQALEAAVRRAHVLARGGELNEARDLLYTLRSQLPQLSQRFFLAEGELLMEHDQADAAVALYGEALEEFPDDADLTYARTLAFERQQRFDLAERDLRAMIERNPEDVRALNALGYMLTVNTSRYDEAHGLIQRALALAPDDPAIIDSMGWVQFKRGQAQDARSWLEKAYSRFPDGEVAAHLGEVLWQLGERERAQSIWDQALRTDPDHPVLRETLQRLAPP